MRQRLNGSTSGHFHAVRFYENKESLCRIVAEFLGEGLVAHEPAVLIGTPEHCSGVISELRDRHFDIERAQETSGLVVRDARELMATFMIDGVPDAELFQAVASRLFELIRNERPNVRIRAYGEMVDVLWQEGRTTAAVRLEMLWNKLAMTQDFSLLCGYSMGSFYKDAGMADVCDLHTHLIGADGTPAPPLGENRKAV